MRLMEKCGVIARSENVFILFMYVSSLKIRDLQHHAIENMFVATGLRSNVEHVVIA